MMDDLTPRQREILCAIVEDYFVHVRPIASHPLKKEHRMRFSAPTIRGEMLKLEELGYLSKRHSSSGRVPTEEAYQWYVEDLLGQSRPIAGREMRRVVEQWNSIAAELQTFVMNSLQMLSAQLETAAFASLPFVDDDQIRGLEILPIGPGRLALTLDLASGWAETRLMLLPPGAPDFNWDDISSILSERLRGLKIHQVTPIHLRKVLQEVREKVVLSALLESFFRTLRREARVFLDGWQYLAGKPEFQEHPAHARKLADVLSDHQMLFRVVDRVKPADANPGVVWESELKPFGVEGCVMVRQMYNAGNTIGILGVAGPMRMDYRRVLSLLQDYTGALGRRFASNRNPAEDTD
ncbi:MAG: HrcA family transcriptional regulator [bacterium]